MRIRGVVAVLLLAATAARAFAAAPARVMSDAEAGRQCAPADEALATLKARYGEVPFWIGDTDHDDSVIVTRRLDGGSWTLLAVGRDGAGEAMACMVAAGVGGVRGEPTQ